MVWPGRARQGEGAIASVFLTESEWRYVRIHGAPRDAADSSAFKADHPKTPETTCWFCGLREARGNLLQAAHRIPSKAVQELAISSDLLKRSDNFVWAHQRLCNDAVELKPRLVMWRLMGFGVSQLPAFLPKATLEMWEDESKGLFPPPPPKPEARIPDAPTVFPMVSPPSRVRRVEFREPRGAPSPPPPAAVRATEEPKPSGFPTVPPQSAVRRKKSDEVSDEPAEG